VRDAWTTLRIALGNAAREELLARNVAALVRVPKARSHKPKPWSVEEARRFLENARRDDDPLYAGYVLILVLGLRRGEALGLGWEDVDVDAGELRVAWQLQRVGGQLLPRRPRPNPPMRRCRCRTSAPRRSRSAASARTSGVTSPGPPGQAPTS